MGKGGNQLVCHQTPPSASDLAEIEALGGIDGQWICHQHDTLTGSSHEELHARFGCVLHHHVKDRPAVRKRTRCPSEQHGDEGLRQDADFEVIFWPTCTSGHCIFRWRNRGKYYLFTSHAIYAREGAWELQCNKRRLDSWRPHVARLSRLQVDYVFPGYSPPDEDGFYRLNDESRKRLSEAMGAAA